MKQRLKNIVTGVGFLVLQTLVVFALSIAGAFVAMVAFNELRAGFGPYNEWMVPLLFAASMVGLLYVSVAVTGWILGCFAKHYAIASFQTMYVLIMVLQVLQAVVNKDWLYPFMGIVNVLLVMTMLQSKFAPLEIELRKENN